MCNGNISVTLRLGYLPGRVPGKYIKANSSSGYENKHKACFERFFDRLQRYEQQIIALEV